MGQEHGDPVFESVLRRRAPGVHLIEAPHLAAEQLGVVGPLVPVSGRGLRTGTRSRRAAEELGFVAALVFVAGMQGFARAKLRAPVATAVGVR